ncbi:MAG: Gldg family protein [Eubacteriales bacterium]|nr:Gldg family protein [Eubacteriales bacterium]
MGTIKSTIKSNKFKYGSYSVIFIAVFVALVIALNLVVSFLDSKYNLKIDLTENQLYTVGSVVDETLKTALGDKYSDFDLTITFCTDRDMFKYYDTIVSEVNTYYTSVRDVAEQYARIYNGTNGKGKITVNYIDIVSDPASANKIKQQTQLDTISWDNIIIQNNTNLKYYRVLAFGAFYRVSDDTGNLYAFQGENRFTASIIQCAVAENMTVALSIGNGEKYSSQLKEIFELSTLNVVEIDLSKDDIPKEANILVISAPLYDFTYGNEGEIDRISDFLSDKETYHSLMVFVNASTPDLPNLRDYLREQWGLDYLPNHKITDETYSVKGSGFQTVIGKYSPGDTSSAAYVLHRIASEAGVSTVFNNAVQLTADTTGLRSIYVEVSLYAYPTAKVTYHSDTNGEEFVTESAGSCPLLAISTYHTYANDDFNYNANKYQYVMLVGSTDFATGDYLSGTYGNQDIIYSATRAMATDRVALDIDFKQFDSAALTLTSGTAKKLMILVTCAIPSVIIIIGIAVFLKRRHL